MCNQNQGKEKKVSDPPYYLSDQSKSHKKNLRKYLLQISIINTLLQINIFVQKLNLRKV